MVVEVQYVATNQLLSALTLFGRQYWSAVSVPVMTIKDDKCNGQMVPGFKVDYSKQAAVVPRNHCCCAKKS
jgi:hypothetical protein